jgi:hypothetical protein
MNPYSVDQATVGDTVTFPFRDEDQYGERVEFEAVGTVREVDPATGEVFVSEPGNAGAEGWVAAERCWLHAAR